MGIKIRFYNKNRTIQRLRNVWDSEVLPKVSDQIMEDSNTYVRMQSGELASTIDKENGGKRITWNTAYAKRVYYTGTPRKNVNPNASLRWCEKAIRNHKSEWVKEANSILKG